jgi:hypothetical protein
MQAIARWDAFLAQIQSRHQGVLVEAEVNGRQFIASIAAGGDPIPLSHSLMGTASRLQDLESKIIDTWHEKVSQAITDDGNPDDVRDRQYDKGQDLKWALEDARDELEPRLFAELARQRYQHALAAARVFDCAACGRRMNAPISFRVIELACACGARNVFDPGELMQSVAAVGTHAIAQEAAVHEWRAMKAAERRAHRFRPPKPLAAVVEVERTQVQYWRAYLAVRSRFEPEMGRDPAMEIRSRMEQWYVAFAEYEPAWVAAGRPKSI